MTDDAMVEKVAAAIAERDAFHRDDLRRPLNAQHFNQARAAIAATGVEEMREALETARLCCEDQQIWHVLVGAHENDMETTLGSMIEAALGTTREEPK